MFKTFTNLVTINFRSKCIKNNKKSKLRHYINFILEDHKQSKSDGKRKMKGVALTAGPSLFSLASLTFTEVLMILITRPANGQPIRHDH